MSYKRKLFEKQRNPVAKNNKYKGGPHGPSMSSKRQKEKVVLNQTPLEEEVDWEYWDWRETQRNGEEYD